MSGPENFETWLNGLLLEPDDAALQDWVRRMPAEVGPAETLILREAGYLLLRDGSVTATWRLVRLRGLLAFLAMRRDEEVRYALMAIWREIELGGAGPAGTAAQVLNYRGCVLAEQEQFSSAVEHFSAAIDADAEFVPAYLNRVRSLLELDRPEDARADAEAAVARDPQYPRATFTARLVDVLLTIATNRPPLFTLLAAAHGLLDYLRTYDRPARPGEFPDPSGWDESAITPLPRPAAAAGADEWNHVGVVDGRVGRYAEAIEAFQTALRKDPGYSRARYNLAKAYQMAGDHQRAISEMTKVIQEGRAAADELALRARSFRALWQIEAARADDEAAAELESQSSAGRRPPELPDLSDLLRMMAGQPVDLAPWEAEDAESALAQLEQLHRRGRYRDGLILLGRLAQRPAPTPWLQARLHQQRAAILAGLDRPAEALEQYSAALALLADGPADEVRVRCLEARADCYPDADDRRTADLRAALLLTLSLGDRLMEGRLRARLGQEAEARGHLTAAASWYQSAHAPAREAEDWASIAAILDRRAAQAARAGRQEEAQACREERDRTIRDAGSLAFLGPMAQPRAEVVRAARDTLLAKAPDLPIVLGCSTGELTAVLDHADMLRREQDRPADALPCYYTALAICMQLDDPDELAGCLTGMGSAYETLAGQAAGRALLALAEEPGEIRRSIGGSIGLIAAVGQALATGQAADLTRCAQAAYRWALEEMRRCGDLARQAMQVSNLAVIEARLGNLDTAARYDRWALGVHTRAGTSRQVMVDLGHLSSVAERLGDEEAARLRAQWEELRDAGHA